VMGDYKHYIWATIALVIAVLLAWLLVELAQAEQQELYGGVPLDAVLIRLDKKALDTAYEQRLVKLWEVWLSPTTKDKHGFTTGLKVARQRYGEAAMAIASREKQLEDAK